MTYQNNKNAIVSAAKKVGGVFYSSLEKIINVKLPFSGRIAAASVGVAVMSASGYAATDEEPVPVDSCSVVIDGVVVESYSSNRNGSLTAKKDGDSFHYFDYGGNNNLSSVSNDRLPNPIICDSEKRCQFFNEEYRKFRDGFVNAHINKFKNYLREDFKVSNDSLYYPGVNSKYSIEILGEKVSYTLLDYDGDATPEHFFMYNHSGNGSKSPLSLSNDEYSLPLLEGLMEEVHKVVEEKKQKRKMQRNRFLKKGGGRLEEALEAMEKHGLDIEKKANIKISFIHYGSKQSSMATIQIYDGKNHREFDDGFKGPFNNKIDYASLNGKYYCRNEKTCKVLGEMYKKIRDKYIELHIKELKEMITKSLPNKFPILPWSNETDIFFDSKNGKWEYHLVDQDHDGTPERFSVSGKCKEKEERYLVLLYKENPYTKHFFKNLFTFVLDNGEKKKKKARKTEEEPKCTWKEDGNAVGCTFIIIDGVMRVK